MSTNTNQSPNLTAAAWRSRALSASNALAASKEREAELLAELIEARADYDDLLGQAAETGIEQAKTWLIKQQSWLIRRLRAEVKR